MRWAAAMVVGVAFAYCAAGAQAQASAPAASGQVETPASRLEAASALTSLDGVDQPAWHLKMDVTLFDPKGKNPSSGTIEVWHAANDERSVAVFGDASATMLRHDGKRYIGSTGAGLPFDLEELVRPILHPGPEASELKDAVPELRKQKFGKSEFDCVMLTQPIKGVSSVPLGFFPTYCLSGGVIRAAFNFGNQAVVLNRIGTFLGRDVAIEAAIREGDVEVASLTVATLATYTPKPGEFDPGATMAEVGDTARISGSVIAGYRIVFVEPVYPESAKRAHLSGTVILEAIIGRDGRVHSLKPVGASNPNFVLAAIAAVREWRYRPYMLNGDPTEVDTTITVNFAIGQR